MWARRRLVALTVLITFVLPVMRKPAMLDREAATRSTDGSRHDESALQAVTGQSAMA